MLNDPKLVAVALSLVSFIGLATVNPVHAAPTLRQPKVASAEACRSLATWHVPTAQAKASACKETE